MSATAQDLSQFARPVADLFPAPQSDAQWQALQLSSEQIAHYREHGYVAGIKLLNDEQVSRLRAELDEFFQPDHAGRDLWYEYHSNESTDPALTLFHALGAWRIGEAFHDLLWNPAFTVPASQLLEGPVRFWHDQLFCKPARHGGVVAWHQDYSYWTRTQPMAHLTCWIALDDSDEANGVIQYIPGSHRWPLLPMTDLAGDMNGIREALTPEQWEQFQHPTRLKLRAGEAAMHHPLTVHGSLSNRTDRPRRAAVINVVRDGVCSEAAEPLLEGTPALGVGVPLGGQFFPLLCNAQGQLS